MWHEGAKEERLAVEQSKLSPSADQIDEAPPGDPGHEAVLVGGHAFVHHLPGKGLHFLGCFAHVTGVEWRMRIVFDRQLDRFGLLAPGDFAR